MGTITLTLFPVYLYVLLSGLVGILGTDGRALGPVDPLISSQQMKEMIRARASKPKDLFTPHDPPFRWAAMGDSYTAGPGAGDPWDENDHLRCLTTKASYAVQLHEDFLWDIADADRKFLFSACTGHKINDMVDQQLPQLPDNAERQDFIVMTIGGNDMEFSKIVRICALGLRSDLIGDRTCDQQLRASGEIVESDDFRNKLWDLWDRLFKKLDQDEPNYHYQLYHLQYPRPFEWDTDDDWCNDKDLYHDCTIKPTEGPKLTKQLRRDINDIVDKLNRKILSIAIDYIKDKGSNRWRGHMPGWFRNRLFVVDPRLDYVRHRFCEKGARSFDDPSIYFIPYCDRAQGESGPQLMTLDDFKLDANTCNTTDQYKSDEMYQYECQISVAKAYRASEIPADTKFVPPENWAKVFHPRANGFAAYKTTLVEALSWERPPQRKEGSSEACRPLEIIAPTEESITYQKPRPDGEMLCPPEEEAPNPEEPPAPEPPKGPPKSVQMFYHSHVSVGADNYNSWRLFEGEQGKMADPCDESKRRVNDESASDSDGWNPPFADGEWPFRPDGYAEDCTFIGIGRKGESGDVAWLRCPERPDIMCTEPPERNQMVEAKEWKNCGGKGDTSDDYIPVAACDWS